MDEEYRDYEYNWSGTNFELPPIYISARFDCVDSGLNGDDSHYEEWELTEFDASFDEMGGDSHTSELKHMFVYVNETRDLTKPATLTNIYDLIEKDCYAQWGKE